MIVPEREKGVHSFRIPKIALRAIVFLLVAITIVISILGYDYWQILSRVNENKHLIIENRALKEEITLFQMKINGLTESLERIHVFEKKLRIISGLDQRNIIEDKKTKVKKPRKSKNIKLKSEEHLEVSVPTPSQEYKTQFKNLKNLKHFENEKGYLDLLNLYEQKIAANFGQGVAYGMTKDWNELTKQSFSLASDFAAFDYKYKVIKDFVGNLEESIHQIDQYLIDRNSFLKATPTLLPVKGWITSYYGPRMSHYSGRVKMHEGLDIGASRGTKILSPADGLITFSGKKPGFGHFVQIDHGYGIETIYAHNSKNTIKKGEIVKRGQLIARVGNTGYSTGPHLHYEVRINGTPVDPLYYILD